MGGFVTDVLEKIGASEAGQAVKSAIKSAVISGYEAMQREGAGGAGLELRSMIENADKEHAVTASKAINEYHGLVKDLPAGAWDAVREHLDLGKTAPTADLQTRATVIKSLQDDAYTKAVQAGVVDPKYKIKNYFPHLLPDDVYGGPKRDKLIDHLIKTNQASSRTQAEQIIARQRMGGQRVPSLELRRTVNYPDYRKDKAVQSDVLNAIYKRLAQVKYFGKNDELLMQKLDQVAQQGGDKNFVKHIAEMQLGRRIGINWTPGYVEGGNRRSGPEAAASSVEAASKLSLAVLRHVGQGLNIPIVAKMGPTIRGLADALSRGTSIAANSLDQAAVLESTIRQIRREAGVSQESIGSKVMRTTGFYDFDRFRRIWASTAGRFQANDEFKKLLSDPNDAKALRMLNFLGVDTKTALANKSLSDSDLLAAGKRVSDVTQFTTNAGNLPVWWRDTPEHRIFTMFKQFFFQQSKFLKDYVIKPALRPGAERDLRPLIVFSTLYPTFGELIADANEYVRKGTLKERPNADKFPADRIADNIANIGGFGIWYDMFKEFSTGDKSAFWSFLGGPVLGDVVDAGHIASRVDLHSSHPLEGAWKELEKKGIRAVPGIGSILYHKQFPTKGHKYDTPFQKGTITKLINKL